MFSQAITVDNSSYTPAQLVNLLMQNSCSNVSNISMSNGNSVGYFNKNGSSFPLTDGIIIRTGNINFTQGNYTGANLTSSLNNNTDSFLQNLSNTNSGTSTLIKDVAFLEFDFTPISDNFSFNFLFSSNEYGSQQCISNDVFAFVLTDLSTNVSRNLAIVPGSNDPVSVKSIRNSVFNSNCSSSNAVFFDTYTLNNPTAAPLNMKGYTKRLTASSAVVPNNSYRLKLVIADYGDVDYDSAVFIQAGSFSDNFSLGDDRYFCVGDNYILDTGLDISYNYQWLLNGNVIAGENGPTYTVTQPGEYKVIISNNTSSCHIEDSIKFLPIRPIFNNLYLCYNNGNPQTFNLLSSIHQNSIIPANFQLSFYASLANVASNTPIPQSDLSSFQSLGQTIYVKVTNSNSGFFCDALYSFQLEVLPQIILQNDTAIVCANEGIYDITPHVPTIVNGMNGNYSLHYYSSLTDAQNYSIYNTGYNATRIPLNGSTVPNVIYVRFHFNNNINCYAIATVTINKFDLPLVDNLPIQIGCNQVVLPAIINGTYFSGSNGSGTNLGQGGAIIDDGGIYYIFAGPDANGCTNESSFEVFLIDEYEIDKDACGRMIVPFVPHNVGAFYDAPNGNGNLIPTGTTFQNAGNTSIIQPIYFYSFFEGSVCRDELWNIYIHPVPVVDIMPNVTYCNSYTFPPLVNGLYYEVTRIDPFSNSYIGQFYPNQSFNVNDVTAIYNVTIYNELAHTDSQGNTGICQNSSFFELKLVNTSAFTNVSKCGSFMLPEVDFGNYYDQPNGSGNIINPNNPITTSQLVYYYTNTTEFPNCTNNLNYDITILPLPEIDHIESGLRCGEFTLPALNYGTYYTLPGGPTTINQVQLNPYQVIDLTGLDLSPGTYYIYNGPDVNGCENEVPFTIDIASIPLTDNVIDQLTCSTYTIGTATNGTFYTAPNGPNGNGSVVNPSEVFNDTRTFYIYNIDPISGCVVDNPFTIYYNAIELPNYADVDVCENANYSLPPLSHLPPEPSTTYSINYYLDTNANGIAGDFGDTIIPAGTVFNTPNTITTVYVVARNVGRFGIVCEEIDDITITVYQTPNLATLGLVFDNEKCGTYVLPTLPTTTYNIGYYSQSGGNAADIIANLNITTPGTYTYYVYASAIGNPNCNDEISFTFTVHPLLNITIQGGIICVDSQTGDVLRTFTMDSGLNPAFFTLNWYLNGTLMGTGPTYTASQAGVYTVEFIKLTPDVGANCNYNTTTVTIVQSSPAVANFTVSTPFENNTFITVNLTGGLFGDYLYQLVYPDGNVTEYQSSNVFTNLPTGEYYVNIYDILGGCSQTTIGPIYIINYPNYFTPNADGVNDNWNIWDLSHQPDAVINIFDRYGKFLKQMSPASSGWDGIYNGEKLPSTDYWFTVEYLPQNGTTKQIFKAHFSLKR